MDLWIDTSNENKLNLIEALKELNYDTEELIEYRLDDQPPIDIPISNFRIELINLLTTVIDFKEAYKSSEEFQIDKIKVRVLHLNHLIKIKEASNRPKDLMDVEELKRIHRR